VGSAEEQAPPQAFERAAAESERQGSGPDDANDLRGVHFKQLLSGTATLALIGILVVAAGVAAGVFVKSAPLGGAAAVAALLISLLVVFAIADARSADTFFEAYSMSHGLTLMDGRMRMPKSTPLLGRGDDQYAERLLEGPLGPGVEGKLALFTYEEERYDKDGKETDYYRYTLGLTDVPEVELVIPELYVQRKSGLRSLEKFEDVFRRSKQRVELESEALDRKYEIFVRDTQDLNWVRQLFSPTFIVWLTERAPEKFAFELVGGNLCCYVNGHKENSADLNRIRGATTAVATRLREEALE
jgi:hypothetical protein